MNPFQVADLASMDMIIALLPLEEQLKMERLKRHIIETISEAQAKLIVALQHAAVGRL